MGDPMETKVPAPTKARPPTMSCGVCGCVCGVGWVVDHACVCTRVCVCVQPPRSQARSPPASAAREHTRAYRGEGPRVLVDGRARVDHHARADAEIEPGAVSGEHPVVVEERDAGGDLHACGFCWWWWSQRMVDGVVDRSIQVDTYPHACTPWRHVRTCKHGHLPGAREERGHGEVGERDAGQDLDTAWCCNYFLKVVLFGFMIGLDERGRSVGLFQVRLNARSVRTCHQEGLPHAVHRQDAVHLWSDTKEQPHTNVSLYVRTDTPSIHPTIHPKTLTSVNWHPV